MKKFFIQIFSGCLLPALLVSACHQSGKWMVKDKELKNNWHIQSSAKINTKDQAVSIQSYKLHDQPAGQAGWYKAEVPGTVLGSLVADSVFKNVFFHRNLQKIPDSLFSMPWWYRTTFKISRITPGQTALLQFNGINYRADIWLNGHQIASADMVKGGFCRFSFDVSRVIKEGNNVLAVKITRPGPGEPTFGFVDWNPEPPDHNMGIWRDVHLKISGPVSIGRPFVQSKVDTATLDHAELTVSAWVTNHSDKEIQGILQGNTDSGITFSQKITLSPQSRKKVTFSPEKFTQLKIDHPRLWWVHTLGKPNLYNLHLKFNIDGQASDSQYVRFGIRSVSDYMTSDSLRGYKLNGKKILVKGGGWTDPMLLNASPAYERAGIDYAVQMGLNAIRMEGFWGQNQHLYNMCDEKGLLVMVGFSAEWEWEGVFGTPADQYGGIESPEQMAVAVRSWKDQVIWLRNHPSVFLWLYGSDKIPRPSLEKQYLSILKKYDPTRPYLAAAKEHTSTITGPTAVKMRGPYDYVPPNYWYIDTLYGGAFGFNTETGPGPQIPVLESLKKMIPADSLWPIGTAWLYHAARGNFHNLTYYNNAMEQRLGKPTDLQDYLRKAQYLNYEGMRAMFEAFETHRFKSTGIIQWMYNASWPKLWWQLYDYYLMPNAAFYGAKKANEPIHIAYNYGNRSIEVMNNTAESAGPLSAEIRVLNFNLSVPPDSSEKGKQPIPGLKPVLQKTIPLSYLVGQETTPIFQLPEDLDVSKTWFLDLRLFDQMHHVVSTNFYALSTQKDKLNEAKSTWFVTPQTQYADLTLLQKLPSVKLQVSQAQEKKDSLTFLHLRLKNPSSHLAFMIHLDLKKDKSTESVVPVFWDENYFTLLPGEERTVSVHCYTKDLDGQKPHVVIEGWNIK